MTVSPYGSWRSPITPDVLVERVGRISDLVAVGGATEGEVWWNESRPAEAGRQVIVRCSADGVTTDAVPPGFSARTTVHEYGGGSFAVGPGQVYFSNFADQRLWQVGDHGPPRPLTPEPPEARAWRFADAELVPPGSRLVCVRERHQAGEVVNDLVAVPTGGGEPVTLVAGHDFFAAPRTSPDGASLAWLTWDHPDMPWDATRLWAADLVVGDGGAISVARTRLVAGGPEESVSQPRWSPDGRLHWASDRTGWWNLYADDGAGGRPLAPRPAEFSRPDWVFGQSTYAFLPDGRLVAVWSQHGIDRLVVLEGLPDPTGRFEPLETPYTTVESLRAWGSSVVVVAASPTEEPAVVELPLDGGSRVLRRSRDAPVDPAVVSEAQPLEFPTTGGVTAHGFYYAPANPDFDAPPGERPPLVVTSHGGPTSAATSALDLGIQFWTTRGIAVVAVNYGGSSGYGRDYRKRLEQNWGVVDVDDCVNAARHLADRGLVDPSRLAIRGSSAGGFTVLAALVSRDLFAAGTSLYGIADLEGLARDTHKFESHYLDRLVGPYPAARELYRQRSPLYSAERVSCPILLLQGADDMVVPLAQAEAMVAALRSRGLPFAYVTFPGEQHGFRRAETIRRAVEVELSFYAQILGFEPADVAPAVAIENLGRR